MTFQLTTVMGSSQSTSIQTIVLQTGDMRAKYITQGVRAFDDASRLPEGVIHRFLPNHLECKYEALDFTNKFNITDKDSFTIYNDLGHLISLSYGTPLLENIGIVCSIGTSSTQAFKLTTRGPKPLLPITQTVLEDPTIVGDKSSPYLTPEALSKFGSKSDNQEIAQAVVDFLQANSNDKNIIFVNAIGYSVLGFNIRTPDGAKKVLVPRDDQKVMKLKSNTTSWNVNKNNTQLINVLKDVAYDNMYVVCRQCKIKMPEDRYEELSGQWTKEIRELMREPELEIDETTRHSIVRAVDLGGGSGTLYVPTETKMFGLWSDGKYKKDDSISILKDNNPNTILRSTEEEEEMKTTFYEALSKSL